MHKRIEPPGCTRCATGRLCVSDADRGLRSGQPTESRPLKVQSPDDLVVARRQRVFADDRDGTVQHDLHLVEPLLVELPAARLFLHHRGVVAEVDRNLTDLQELALALVGHLEEVDPAVHRSDPLEQLPAGRTQHDHTRRSVRRHTQDVTDGCAQRDFGCLLEGRHRSPGVRGSNTGNDVVVAADLQELVAVLRELALEERLFSLELRHDRVRREGVHQLRRDDERTSMPTLRLLVDGDGDAARGLDHVGSFRDGSVAEHDEVRNVRRSRSDERVADGHETRVERVGHHGGHGDHLGILETMLQVGRDAHVHDIGRRDREGPHTITLSVSSCLLSDDL